MPSMGAIAGRLDENVTLMTTIQQGPSFLGLGARRPRGWEAYIASMKLSSGATDVFWHLGVYMWKMYMVMVGILFGLNSCTGGPSPTKLATLGQYPSVIKGSSIEICVYRIHVLT